MDRHPTAQRILDAAVRLIDETGEAGLRIQDVQTTAEVTAPSIYHFFGSRDGLVREAQAVRLRRTFDANDATLDEVLADVRSKEDLRRALTGFLRIFFDSERARVRQQRMATLGSVEGRPDLADHFAHIIDGYVEERTARLRPFQEKGWIEPDLDLRVFNYWLLGVVFGRAYVELADSSAPQVEWDLMSERAIAFIMFGPD